MRTTSRLFNTLPKLLIFSVVLILASNGAHAKDYIRSCSVRYFVNPVISGGGGNSARYDFQGKGKVGYYNPNEARRRARRKIDECINAHWQRRQRGTRPTECSESNRIYNYPFTQLNAEIGIRVCNLNPGRSSMDVNINVTYHGKKGCTLDNNSWNRTIATNHRINCADRPREPGVDRPGMDIERIILTTNDPVLCEDACRRNSRCRAWTYVNPGVQGDDGRARCYLKSGVPEPRPSSCCTSGVMIEP